MKGYNIDIPVPLVLKRLSNELVETAMPFIVNVYDKMIVVPEGFVSNGNSTPRTLWSIIPPLAGEYGEAGVVHDYLYDTMSGNVWSRIESDKIHFSIGRYRGANLIKAMMIYKSLRMFGGTKWKAQ